MVIPVGLLGTQQLVVVEKDLNGRSQRRKLCRYYFRCLRDPSSRYSGRPDQTIAGIIIGLESAADREGSPSISAVEGKADITRTSAKVHS
jgi:hypothetical protein